MARTITVFVSCTGELSKEKQIVHNIAKRLNAIFADKCDVVILVKDWRTIIGQYGIRPQEIINIKFDAYDIYLGMWWMHFGTKTGAIDPDTGKEYESGTYEEFVIAKHRWEQKKDLPIYLFFKEPKITKDPELLSQYQKVCAVRNNESKNNFVHDFLSKPEFERKITDLLYSHAMDQCIGKKQDSISEPSMDVKAKFLTFVNNIKKPLANYVPRQLISATARKVKAKTFTKQPTSSLHELIYVQKKIVLLGDAGSGKSTELRHLFNYYSEPGSSFYPIFQSLNLYTPETGLDRFLPEFWKEIHPSKLLIIWDGLDEIAPSNFQSVLKQISNFSNNNPEIRIIISSRTNFYEIPDAESTGSLEQFHPYFISEFGSSEIKTFLQNIDAPYDAKDFIHEAYANNYSDLAAKPFFLPILGNVFGAEGNLLIKRSVLFEKLLVANLNANNKHYKGNATFETNTQNTLILLQRVALAMEIMCKNSISTAELKEITSNDELELLKYSGIFNLTGVDESVWQFLHNNLQEYLAAKALSSVPFKEIIELISVGKNIKKLIPSWVNTLTFLFSILEPTDPLFNELLNWLLINDKEAIVKFEKDKIPPSTRNQIFESIFEFYEERNVWLRSNKFNDTDLARFSQSEQSIKYLLEVIEENSSTIVKTNAIGVLGHYDYKKSKLGLQVKRVLVGIVTTPSKDYQYLYSTLNALNFANLLKLKDLKSLIKKLSHIKNQYVRSPIYLIINKLNAQDLFIDYLMEGYDLANTDAKVAGRDDITLFGESIGIEEAFKSVSSDTALGKLINYLNDNTDYSPRSKYEITEAVLNTAVQQYSPLGIVHKNIVSWFVRLLEGFRLDKLQPLITYFKETNSANDLFMHFWELGIESHKKYMALAYLTSESSVEFLVKKYIDREITKTDMLNFYYNLRSRNSEHFPKLVELLGKTEFEVPSDNRIDYDALYKKRNQQSFNLLFDAKKLESETLDIFNSEQTNQLTFDELFDIRKINNKEVDLEDRYPGIALEILRDFASKNRPADIDKVKSWFAKPDHVEWFTISKIYQYLKDTAVEPTPEQIRYISDWCTRNLSLVNFKTAITQEQAGSTSYNMRAIYMWYFFRKFDLKYPKNVLLDMLSFDMFEKNEWAGLNYLSALLSRDEMTERIIDNIQKGVGSTHALLNHIKYAVERKLTSVYPIILKEILNSKHSIYDRQSMLSAYIEGTKDYSNIKKLLPKAEEELYWSIIDILYKANDRPFLLRHLSKRYVDLKNNPQGYRVLEYLIKLHDLKAIQLYVKQVKSKGKVFVKEISYNSISSISDPKALPSLLELLKISYVEKFDEDRFESFQTSVLGAIQNIGLLSESDFKNVIEQLNKFIDRNKELKYVNFLFHTIQRMEEKFYFNSFNSYTIQEVKKKLKLVA